MAMSKNNQIRWQSFFNADGSPKKVRVYSNLGTEKETADCYTVVFTGSYRKKTGGQFWAIGCSGDPFSPLGIGSVDEYETQIDKPTYSHLGKKISYSELSENAKKYVLENYKYLWGFADEKGNSL